jgi:hypothetical protein
VHNGFFVAGLNDLNEALNMLQLRPFEGVSRATKSDIEMLINLLGRVRQAVTDDAHIRDAADRTNTRESDILASRSTAERLLPFIMFLPDNVKNDFENNAIVPVVWPDVGINAGLVPVDVKKSLLVVNFGLLDCTAFYARSVTLLQRIPPGEYREKMEQALHLVMMGLFLRPKVLWLPQIDFSPAEKVRMGLIDSQIIRFVLLHEHGHHAQKDYQSECEQGQFKSTFADENWEKEFLADAHALIASDFSSDAILGFCGFMFLYAFSVAAMPAERHTSDSHPSVRARYRSFLSRCEQERRRTGSTIEGHAVDHLAGEYALLGPVLDRGASFKIGRASCRERV